MTKVRAQLYTGISGALRSTEGPLHGANDFCKKILKSTQGKTTFPCASGAVYPFCIVIVVTN